MSMRKYFRCSNAVVGFVIVACLFFILATSVSAKPRKKSRKQKETAAQAAARQQAAARAAALYQASLFQATPTDNGLGVGPGAAPSGRQNPTTGGSGGAQFIEDMDAKPNPGPAP